jgi:hypothetical protein
MKVNFKASFVVRSLAVLGIAGAALFGLSGSANATTCSTETCSITSGHYYMLNDWWGVGSGVTGSQSITFNSISNWSTTYSWSGGESYDVKTYAEVVDGWNWGSFNGSPFPYQIKGGHAVDSNWTLSEKFTGTNDVSWDCFFDASSNPGDVNPNGEMMVWMQANGGAGPMGSQVKTVTVDGWSWKMFEGVGDWPVVSYLPSGANGTSYNANLMEFAQEAASSGYFSSSWYFLNVNAGTEAFNGTGTLTTTNYSAP